MQCQYGTVNHKQLDQDHCIHIALDTSTRNIITISAITVIDIDVFVVFLIYLFLVYVQLVLLI